MVIQRVVEEINQVFPQLGETQIIHDLNIAQKDFVAETNYLEDYVLLSDPSTNCAWTLPADYNNFKEILLYDANGNPLYLEDYQITYEIKYGKLYFLSTTSTPISALPTAIAFIYLGYYKKALDMFDASASFQIEDEHIPVIYAKIYKSYYSKYPMDVVTKVGTVISTVNFSAANYYAQQEVAERIKAKRWLNSKNDTSDGHALFQEAGKWLLPKHIKTLSGGTLSVSDSISGNEKEANFIITPSGVTQVGDIIGFSSMTATLDLPNNRVTFTGDVSSYTDFTANNKGWDKYAEVSGVSITIEWSDGISGIIVATIFEKVSATTPVAETVTSNYADPFDDYKVYSAMLTQAGTDAPVAVVSKNTIGIITWERVGVGHYKITGNFPVANTYPYSADYDNRIMTLLNDEAYAVVGWSAVSGWNEGGHTIHLYTQDENGDQADGLLQNYPFEIKVY